MVSEAASSGEQKQGYVMLARQAARGLFGLSVEVDPRDVVLIKGIIEASDGIAGVFSDHGGALLIAGPPDRRAELLALVGDLEVELGARVVGEFCGGDERGAERSA